MNTQFPNLPEIPFPSGHINTVWEHLQNENEEQMKKIGKDEIISAQVYLYDKSIIFVKSFGYAGPDLLIVYGYLNGSEITAYIHQSCLQVVFTVLKKEMVDNKQPIGFIIEKNELKKDVA